ncbi:MAG: hypothetical protein RLZZ618_2158 [Pseudomonadota bacterium]|jgi:predicted metal-dependent hydrolase
MTDLVVRRLLVDMQQPIARDWCGGDAFRSALFNALSMSFPSGEQFFIDAVRDGHKALPAAEQARFKDEVQGFIGQEATHRRLHSLYNGHLQQMGLVNEWEPRAKKQIAALEGVNVRHWLAITAANEHFTAIFAEWLLRNPEVLGSQDERLATAWLWHSAEESEHRSTAFDLYRALGGNDEWRLRWFRRVSFGFVVELLRQTALNLRSEGALWRWSTWRSGASFFFGQKGLVRQTFKPWKDYLKKDFHPRHHDDMLSRRWLEANSGQFSVVRG